MNEYQQFIDEMIEILGAKELIARDERDWIRADNLSIMCANYHTLQRMEMRTAVRYAREKADKDPHGWFMIYKRIELFSRKRAS